MRKKLIALALTLPATITIALAQAPSDYDIQAYSQDLYARLMQGQQLAYIDPSNYQSLMANYNQVEMIRRAFGSRPMNPMERTNVMNSLMNIDRYLTEYIHDDENARYNLWNPATNSWQNNWWKNRKPIDLKHYRFNNPPPHFDGKDKKFWDRNPHPKFNWTPPKMGGHGFGNPHNDDHHGPGPGNPPPNTGNPGGNPGNHHDDHGHKDNHGGGHDHKDKHGH